MENKNLRKAEELIRKYDDRKNILNDAECRKEIMQELVHYIPEIELYAETHTQEECIEQTANWRKNHDLYDATEEMLNMYIRNSLF